jgi:hypothetical protein
MVKTIGRFVPAIMSVVLLVSTPAMALDGRLDVRGVRSEGLTADNEFTTSILRVDSSLEQYVRLSSSLVFRANIRNLFEDSESRSNIFVSSYGTRTWLPALSLNYRNSSVRAGLSTDGYYRDYTGATFGQRLDERFDTAAFFQTNFERGNVMLRANDSTAKRRVTSGEWIENHDRSLRGSLQYNTSVGEFHYTGSVSRDEALTAGLRRDRTAHGLRYQGSKTWNEGRGRASIEARTDLFDETVTTDLETSTTRLTPFQTSYVLDDTPEELDPLEPDLTSLVGLSDFDRDTPTSLNIGDDALPVREFGGDYRNLVIDFGDQQVVGSAKLYVDRIVRFPEFMQWRLYTSDDPDGIDWTEVSPAILGVAWQEWNDGRQGWEFTLVEPVTARRFKLVNIKTGPTEPDIFLNELEYYDPQPVDVRTVDSTTRRHRLVGSLSYDLTGRLTVGYLTNLTKREYGEESRDLTGEIHTLSTRLRLDGWNLVALYSLNSLKSPSRLNTDTRTLNMSATSDISRSMWTRFSWHHNLDSSLERDRVNDDYGVDASWRGAPGLTILQKVGYGTRDDDVYDIESRSWFSSTTMRSQPRRSVTLDLRRSSRWVSRDVGEGYSSFDDTDGTLRWSIFPLLAYSGQVRYESRDHGEWLWRHVLSWSPLTAGSIDMRFSINRYSDTRTDIRQQGGGVQVTWNARPSLRMEGRMELQEHERNGVTSTPFNTQWRATWTF